MRIKEIQRTAHVAWSPAAQYPVYLAAGTAAQQIDASFSTASQLELYSLDLNDPGTAMVPRAAVPTGQRFHKLVWGSLGMTGGDRSSGVIVGGGDQGLVAVYDAANILDGLCEGEAGVCLGSGGKKHSGAVRSLDLNPSQTNLLASGSVDSEIYIWDLNSPSVPMTPGSLSQPADEVACLAWNRKVQHILASTFPSRCVVWDLRKNEPIIKVSDNTSRLRYKSVAWHPEEAIQMCLASEEDSVPVIQLWDLRFATSPLKTFQGHNRGILSMAWCPQDSDLLLSCGRDNRLLVWNPNSGQILSELSTSNEWCFDSGWCPRNPCLIAASSFDGRVGVHSIMGGRQTSVETSSSVIADSFAGMIPVAGAGGPEQPQQKVVVYNQLSKPPNWLKSGCGASFAFGGKLVTFGHGGGKVTAGTPQIITVNQVVTEPDLVERSKQLETFLMDGDLAQLCSAKAESTRDETWKFLGANFADNPRLALLQLLGYGQLEAPPPAEDPAPPQEEVPAVAPAEAPLPTYADPADAFDAIANAVDAFDAISLQPAPADSAATEVEPVHSGVAEAMELQIATDDSIDGLISRALLIGDLRSAVDQCFRDGRFADSIILAMAGPPELLAETKERYFKASSGGSVARIIRSVVTRNWAELVSGCSVDNWKEALAAAATYADDTEFASLCHSVGERLEHSSGAEAILCFVCSGSTDKVVDCLLRAGDGSTGALQQLVEQVMILRKAQQRMGRPELSISSGSLAEQLVRYASLLASEGKLEAALTYLQVAQDSSMLELKERLERALGVAAPALATASVAPAVAPMSLATNQWAPQQQVRQQRTYAQPYAQESFHHPAPTPPAYQTAAPAAPSYPTPSWRQQQQQGAMFSPPPALVAAPPPSFSAPQPTPPPFYAPPVAPSVVPPVAPSVAPPAHVTATPSVPPPPTMGNASRGGVLSQRSRVYVQDPSVYGANAPRGGSGYSASPASFFGATPSPAAFTPSPAAFGTQFQSTPLAPYAPPPPNFQTPFSNQQPLTPAAPSAVPMMIPPTTAPAHLPAIQQLNSHPPPTAPSAFAPPPAAPAPLVPASVTPFAPIPLSAPTPPLVNGFMPHTAAAETASFFNSPVERAATPVAPPPPKTPPVSQPPPGWNDPPVFTTRVRQPESVALEPITHPIFGSAVMEQAPNPYTAAETQHYAPQSVTPVPSDTAAFAGTSESAVAHSQVAAPTPVAPEPVPIEHQIIHDTFSALKEKCSALASNPQMKRKLEDVCRKLENLDERLRTGALSSNTLNGLHQIVQSVQAGDYNSSLGLHTQLVSGTNFTEIGSFMPGLKVLLQMSSQLGVTA